jgi:hypothetical protein
MDLQTVIDALNNEWTCGEICLMSYPESVDTGIDDVQPTDIMVYYDYCADDLSSTDENKLSEWLYSTPNGGLDAIGKYLASQGYEVVGENDGSGGGLYYGAINFRKI